MRFLLDTHIWLWSSREPDKLSSRVQPVLGDPENGRFLSPISIWEALLLVEKQKLEMHEDFAKWFRRTAYGGRSSLGGGRRYMEGCARNGFRFAESQGSR
jgi:PIN domain nuclease of toxin-antitoxin system